MTDKLLLFGLLLQIENAVDRKQVTPQSPAWVALRAYYSAQCENEEELKLTPAIQ